MMMSDRLERILGPRAPAEVAGTRRVRYLLPTLFLVGAAVLLIVSIFLPYWSLVLHAPQYPQGLVVHAFVTHLEGDVSEIDGLNHYIGMRPLGEAAQFERSISIFAIGALALLVLAAVFIHSPWSALLALPAILLPAVFLIDLYYWLSNFGQNLDPNAALSSSIEPFTPTILGEGIIGQFKTVAFADFGLLMAVAASILILIGLFLQRRAYKPLVEAEEQEAGSRE
jgi:copper chaperone NosL